MRTGAIFARGSCRALKWMALVGMVFALGGGEALAQVTGTAVIEAEAHGYSKKIVVVDLDTDVWGTNVPAGAFAITGNTADSIMGLSTSSPGSDKFRVSFVGDVAVGNSLVYTPPSGAAARELKMADGADAGTDPDQVATFTLTVTEEDNAPVLPAIPAITVNQATTYTAASPAGKLPAVTGGSGTGTIVYSVTPASPFGLTVETDPTSPDFGKITGGPPNSIGTLQVTWTATDGDSPTESARRPFQLIVQAIPATPDKPTVESAASGSLRVSWSAPMDNGSAITHYKVRYKGKGASNYLETATLAASAGTMTTLTGLTNGTEYSVGVQALNGIGWSGWSADGKGTPAMPAVTAPGMPTVTATASDGEVTLAWEAVTGATKYQYAHAQTGSAMGAWMPEAGQPTMTATVGGLTNGMAYTFYVRAGNDAAGYGEAGMATATPMAPEAPGVPTNLTAMAGDGQVTLSWAAPSGGATPTGYEFRSAVDNRWSPWAATSSMTGHTVTGLRNGAEHTFEVRAVAGEAKGQAVSKMATPMAATNQSGRITKFSIDGAEEKNIGGKRMHLTEGEHTSISVTIEWTDVELEELWAGGKPAPQRVYIRARRVEAGNPDWLSGAELEHDVNIGPNFHISVDIPKVPTSGRSAASSGSTQFTVGQDDDAEAEAFDIYVHNAGDFDARSKTESGVFVIEDIHPQGIVLARAKDSPKVAYEGGDNLIYEVKADPYRVDLPLDVRFTLEDVTAQTVASRDNWISADDRAIPPGKDGKASVTVTLDSNDRNRTDDTLKLTAEVVPYALDTGAFDDTKIDYDEFTVLDIHRLPKLLPVDPKMLTLKEGGSTTLKFQIDRNPLDTRAVDPETRRYTHEPIDVTFMDPKGLVTIEPRPVKFKEHNKKAPWVEDGMVTLSVRANEDIDGDRMTMLNVEVAGTIAANGTVDDDYIGVVEVNITDDTKARVWAREDVSAQIDAAKMDAAGDDMIFSKGEMIKLADSDMFGWEQGVSVGLDPKSDNPDVVKTSVSGGMLTVTAEGEGMAMVTVTARASRPASGADIVAQTDPREATITFMVEVGLVALTIELKGPEDNMNLVEGGMPHANGTPGSAMLTATANRPVSVDTTVMLKRDRAMSSASDADYEAEDITIPAGEMTGSTMVTAVDDGMMENAENMPEELVLYGMTEDNSAMVSGQVKLYLWDAAVPALPVIAQLLLAAFLAIGGYRRYRRR